MWAALVPFLIMGVLDITGEGFGLFARYLRGDAELEDIQRDYPKLANAARQAAFGRLAAEESRRKTVDEVFGNAAQATAMNAMTGDTMGLAKQIIDEFQQMGKSPQDMATMTPEAMHAELLHKSSPGGKGFNPLMSIENALNIGAAEPATEPFMVE